MAKADKNRLRVVRAEKRVTQIDIAARAKIGMTRYWKIENGYIDPTPAERAALARALKVQESEAFPATAVAS
jgi:transcriptional regulator with XRE-family HTH domain